MPAVELQDLHYRWPGSNSDFRVPELHIENGESVFILGASGSGKSTLLNLIAGIITPQRGCVRVLGHELQRLGSRKRDLLRATHIGMIFQQFNLVPWLDVAGNIALACRFAGNPGAATTPRLQALLASLQLDPDLLTRRADRLSVGQQQRIAIARALVNSPQLLIADEPTSALDNHARNSFMEVLLEAQTQRNFTILFVSHDSALSTRFSRSISVEALCRMCPADASA